MDQRLMDFLGLSEEWRQEFRDGTNIWEWPGMPLPKGCHPNVSQGSRQDEWKAREKVS
jgi:hypothetical protein